MPQTHFGHGDILTHMPRETVGMLCLGVVAALDVAFMMLTKALDRNTTLPYYFIFGMASIAIAAYLAASAVRKGEVSAVAPFDWIWVILRGFFGSTSWLFAILAASLGTPVGDISALSSVNVIVAAVLGTTVLKEEMKPSIMLAVALSIVGTLLIAQPEAIFGEGHSASRGVSSFGYLSALGSGVCYGFMFVVSRAASSQLSPRVMSSAACFQLGAGFIMVSLSDVLPRRDLSVVIEMPGETMFIFAATYAFIIAASNALSLGAMLVPAVASATMLNSTYIGLGYTADIFLMKAAPKPLTAFGASLVLCGIAVTAFAKRSQKNDVHEEQTASTTPFLAVDEEDGRCDLYHEWDSDSKFRIDLLSACRKSFSDICILCAKRCSGANEGTAGASSSSGSGGLLQVLVA
eukprot:TRINITY_DN103456_c0_g1_i1.p1 TRINITY_DN103456_c0_g1~~TRINITY_DN103456_c0_g1_i1.p1  ORF type:complete len:406 (-),score=72.57 TRINITY_DN103456_c0_g1_i1:111-1328(-)